MKIRATKEFFYSDLNEEDLKCQLLNDMEDTVYPQVLSNNECKVSTGDENFNDDSPLSFLVKFKASNVSPSLIPNGVSGIQLPDEGFDNKKKLDNKSHFNSINVNHYDLTLNSESETESLVKAIRKIDPHYHSFNLLEVKKYLIRVIDDPEWITFYSSNRRWRKFKNKMIENLFKDKHCEISAQELPAYAKTNPDELEDDLKFLKKHHAITDVKKLSLLKKLFPKIYN